ncbi:WD40 repeat-like protein [Meira miltonrushii]|uniref:WD40 repeat-like protein n=1 Tax=Meira miltonrushii TaxID=1280837 RepID=A0A316V5R4_9BASI|nr:WD40 repeat-like protein [Meira miltonrushii]PWN32812.1 WD40 repeat-like protein [Meira miltonrushii]
MKAVDGSIESGEDKRRSTSVSPKGKKRKLEEDDHVEALRTKQFSDSSRPESTGSPHRPSFSKTPASQSSSSLLRAAATGGPAEGRGLRGVDAEVNTEADECGSFKLPTIKSLTTPGELGSNNTPNKMCIRHQSMADEGKTAKLQKSIESLPLADQTAVNTVWSLFSSSPHPRRALILQGLLTMCCSSQLSLLSQELSLAIRLDPFALFPREISLRILKHLDAMTLGRAAQVSRQWKSLADDDLLWRNMCEQHIERKCEKCGWGLPLLNERRKRLQAQPTQSASQQRTSPPDNSQKEDDELKQSPESPQGNSAQGGSLKRAVTAAANAAALSKNAAHSRGNSRAPSPSPTSAYDQPSVAPATRPWKTVYCERLAIERNWRRGRYTTKVLTGHTDGIMCLQFSESLTHPAFPIVITGSYDRTARVWNMETGEELRVLKGHTRGVRCLQFDEAKLITGSMDRTLKIWNWRTGELMRTLEGHTEGIVCLNYNNHILASGSADSNVKIWNFRSGECFTLRGHTDWVNAVLLWSGNGRAGIKNTRWDDDNDDGTNSTFLFSASDDGTIRLWDLRARESLMSFDGHVGQVQSIKLVMLDETAVHKLVINAAGGAGADQAEDIQRRQMQAQRSQGNVEVENQANQAGSYFVNPSNGEAAIEGAPANANNVSCGYNPPAVPGGRTAGSGSAPAIPDRFQDTTASSIFQPSNIKTKPIKTGEKIDESLLLLQKRLYEAGLVEELPLDADMTDLEGPLSPFWNGNQQKANPNSHHAPQRPILISASLDNTIRLWCVRTGRCIRTLFGHTEGIWSLSLDKLRIASASHDRCIKTWDTDTGMCKQTFVGHRGAVTCVQLGDDKIVSGSDDGDCRIWSFAPAPIS